MAESKCGIFDARCHGVRNSAQKSKNMVNVHFTPMHTVKIIKVGIKSSHCNICHCITFIVYVSGRFPRIFHVENQKQKRHGNFFLYYQHLISMIRSNLLQSLKKILKVGVQTMHLGGIQTIGESRYRSRYLPHAKRALYHLSEFPKA